MCTAQQPTLNRPVDSAAGTTQVTTTGCFQEMAGFDNFVLSDAGDAPRVL
jgi:hypothetical protein